MALLLRNGAAPRYMGKAYAREEKSVQNGHFGPCLSVATPRPSGLPEARFATLCPGIGGTMCKAAMAGAVNVQTGPHSLFKPVLMPFGSR
jgi:hypothetical protein